MKVVTTAFPFVPAELGIQHFASTYIPADIYVRALRMLGESVCFVNATDYHSIYATSHGQQDYALCYRMHESYVHAYKLLDVHFDNLITTDDVRHITLVEQCRDALRHRGLIFNKNSDAIFCKGCNTFLPPSFIDNRDGIEVCQICGSRDIIKSFSEHAWLKVSACRDLIEKSSKHFTQYEVQKETQVFLKNLHDWDFTRDNKFGLQYDTRLSFYLWFESLVGYYSLVPSELRADFSFTHFIGKNIVYYHTIIWPILLDAITESRGIPFDVSVRGFMSEKSIISLNIETLCSKYASDLIRFYCAYKVKDNIQDFKLTEGEIENCRKMLLSGPINFINRCIGIFNKMNIRFVSEVDAVFINEINMSFANIIIDLYRCHRINAALKSIMLFAEYSQKCLSGMLINGDIRPSRLVYLAQMLTAFLSPITPNYARMMCIFEAGEAQCLMSDATKIVGRELRQEKIRI